MNADRFLSDRGGGGLDEVLDRIAAGLGLPPGMVPPVVGDDDFDPHGWTMGGGRRDGQVGIQGLEIPREWLWDWEAPRSSFGWAPDMGVGALVELWVSWHALLRDAAGWLRARQRRAVQVGG